MLIDPKQERNRLDKAIAALESLDSAAIARNPGSPQHGGTEFEFEVTKPRRRRRTMSPAARKKISLMMKRR
jgi:hypothetical protein